MSETPSIIRYPDPLKFEDTKWEKLLQGQWLYARCPVCGITLNYATYYCPQCGTDMRKDDAVHVVRCKDCKWQPERVYGIRGAQCNQLWCVCFNTWVSMDHYCSKGERKDDNEINRC